MNSWQIKAVERAHYIALLLAERHESDTKHRVTLEPPYRCKYCQWFEDYTEKAREENDED